MSDIPGFYEWWEQHFSMANLAMGAAEEAWNAATMAERERCAKIVDNWPENDSYLDEIATAIRSDTTEKPT